MLSGAVEGGVRECFMSSSSEVNEKWVELLYISSVDRHRTARVLWRTLLYPFSPLGMRRVPFHAPDAARRRRGATSLVDDRCFAASARDVNGVCESVSKL